MNESKASVALEKCTTIFEDQNNGCFRPISPNVNISRATTIAIPRTCGHFHEPYYPYENVHTLYSAASPSREYTPQPSSAFGLYPEFMDQYDKRNRNPTQLSYAGQPQQGQVSSCREEQGRTMTVDCHQQRLKQLQPYKMIEIAPGLEGRLRGSEETWEAIKNNFIASTHCVCCSELVHCIRDADFAICPTCRVVNPLAEIARTTTEKNVISIGLGMKDVDLRKWRFEIVSCSNALE